MLLEVSCDGTHFLDFLNKAMELQIKPDFNMRGESEFSGFGISADTNPEDNSNNN